MAVTFQLHDMVQVEEVIEVFQNSGIIRPIDQKDRIASMLAHANLIATARDNGRLIGFGRALTDFSYCCYLSDLAVDRAYQKNGIGKTLIALIREAIGEEASLILLSSPGAMDYYPKVGFEKLGNGFVIRRKR